MNEILDDYSYQNQPATYTRYASFWERLAAYLLDGLIVGVPMYIIMMIVMVPLSTTITADPESANLGLFFTVYILFIILSVVAMWLYFAYFESSEKQATIGKQAVGLKVTDLNGNRVSFGKASGRFFGKYLSMIIIYIGFIMVAFTDKKQGLHDMVAGTLVYKKY